MDKLLSRTGLTVLIILAFCQASTAAVADDDNYWEIGLQGGFFLPDKDLSGKPEQASQVTLVGTRICAVLPW